MVCVTVEGLWMVSVRIVDFRFFVKFHSSGPAIIFNLLTLKKHVSYASQKLLINKRPHQHDVCYCGRFSDRIVDFQFLNCQRAC